MNRTKLASQLGVSHALDYDTKTAPFLVLTLRLALGWVLFVAGLEKILAGDWTAAGFLNNAIPAGNPFIPMWGTMAEFTWLIDPLVMAGLTLTGLGLLLGAFVRWNAFWGAVMMSFFWLASLPLSNGILVDSHFVYILALALLGALGAGRITGVDSYLENTNFFENHATLRYFLMG